MYPVSFFYLFIAVHICGKMKKSHETLSADPDHMVKLIHLDNILQSLFILCFNLITITGMPETGMKQRRMMMSKAGRNLQELCRQSLLCAELPYPVKKQNGCGHPCHLPAEVCR